MEVQQELKKLKSPIIQRACSRRNFYGPLVDRASLPGPLVACFGDLEDSIHSQVGKN